MRVASTRVDPVTVRATNARERRARARADATSRSVCVVGGGFAGVALAHAMLERAREARTALRVTVIDRRGVGAGASGVAAGTVHPFTPRGRAQWGGDAGAAATARLVARAEACAEAMDDGSVDRADDPEGGWCDGGCKSTGERRRERVVRRTGLARPARSRRQGTDFARFAEERARDVRGFESQCVTTKEMMELAPGLEFGEDVLEAEAAGEACAGGLFVPGGFIVDAPRYLSALWDACEILANRGVPGTRITLRIATVERVEDLFEEFDDVALCCGAYVAELFDRDVVPVQLQGGHVLELKPENLSVGILGTTYVAPLGRARAMCGPTKEYAATVEDCARAGAVDRADARSVAAERELRELATRAYPPTANWDVVSLKYGVRANPPRTPRGSLPLCGSVAFGERRAWIIAGLGARGLLYHALLADWLSRAIFDDDISVIPEEVRFQR